MKENLTMCGNCIKMWGALKQVRNSCKTYVKKFRDFFVKIAKSGTKGKGNHKALYYYNEEMKEYFLKYKSRGTNC